MNKKNLTLVCYWPSEKEDPPESVKTHIMTKMFETACGIDCSSARWWILSGEYQDIGKVKCKKCRAAWQKVTVDG
jgi:hypothetical protein